MLSKKDQIIKESITIQEHKNQFFLKVKPDDNGCHIWTGQKSHNGYGYWGRYDCVTKKRMYIKAHRFAYALAYGFDALPKGISGGSRDSLVINHICHVRACVNPKHLEVITVQENLDKGEKVRNGTKKKRQA